MILAVVLLVVAAGLLVAGAELFVENAAAAASRLGVTLLATAVLLAGAEPEELLTAVLASAQDRPGLAVGDAVGANVTMLTGALGLAAVVQWETDEPDDAPTGACRRTCGPTLPARVLTIGSSATDSPGGAASRSSPSC